MNDQRRNYFSIKTLRGASLIPALLALIIFASAENIVVAGQLGFPGPPFLRGPELPGVVHTSSPNLVQSRRNSGNYPKRPLSEAVEIEYEADCHGQPRNIAEAAIGRSLHDDCHQLSREPVGPGRVVASPPEADFRPALHETSIRSTAPLATAPLPPRRPVTSVTVDLAEDSTPTEEGHGRGDGPFDTSADCIICPQVLPVCVCPQPSHCQFVSQTCHECAHFICRSPESTGREPAGSVPLMTTVAPSHPLPLTTSRHIPRPTASCISCPPIRLTCNCGPGEICMHRHRTCHQCARIECITPIGSGNSRR